MELALDINCLPHAPEPATMPPVAVFEPTDEDLLARVADGDREGDVGERQDEGDHDQDAGHGDRDRAEVRTPGRLVALGAFGRGLPVRIASPVAHQRKR